MSGHNKWSKIHRQKGIVDQKRGREFSRLSQMITMAVRSGKAGDPNMNPQLRVLLEKAREINMPKDNVQRAIDRGLRRTGEGGAFIEEIVYEGYGPGGVAFMVKTMTTNRNRSLMDIKNALERWGGSLGSPGCAAYAFVTANGKFQPTVRIPVDTQTWERVEKLTEALEGNEEVEQVAHNAQTS